jgi:hypothetical protein
MKRLWPNLSGGIEEDHERYVMIAGVRVAI